MLLNEYIDVKCSSSNKKIYEEKGYKRNDSGFFTIKIADLTKGSNNKIKTKCCNCSNIKDVVYKNYIKQTLNNTKDYYCSECKSIKIKQTHVERYGVESLFELPEFQDKIDNIMLEKYGVKDALSNKDTLEKMNAKIENNYNVKNISQLNNIKKKKLETLSKSWICRLQKKSKLKIIDGNYETKIFTAECEQGKNHQFDISYNLYHNRKEFNSVICTKCHKIGRNIYSNEDKVVNYIKNHYNGKIILNSRKIINPYEIDIYLPEFKLAIELNGFKWHSDKRVGKNYHKNKTDMCNKLGIQLLHFYQDDWIYKEDIMYSIILNKIQKTPNKIFARKCKIVEISNTETKDFMITNHIQGYAISKHNYALVYNNEIVSVLSVGERKISGKSNFELIRYGCKKYTNVIGGFSKLFKFMVKQLEPKEITTFANKSYSNGGIYINNDFSYISDTKPNFHYVINNIRKHRFSFRKDVLVKQGYDKDKTAFQIMDERDIIRIYDSGNKKYIWYNQK